MSVVSRMLRDLGREIKKTTPDGVGFALFADGLYLANGDRAVVADAIRASFTPPPARESPSFHASRLTLERFCVDVAASLAAEWPGRAFIFFAFDFGPPGGRLASKAHGSSSKLDETLRWFVEQYATPLPETPPAAGRPPSS